MKLEIKVGIFVTVALVLLFVMSTQVAELNFSQKQGYKIEIALDNANGLDEYAKVRIRGVDVGYVSNIYLKNNQPHASLIILDHIRIPIDSEVLLTQESMLGGRYIDIVPGKSSEVLMTDGILTHFKSFPTLDETSDAIKQAAKDFQGFIDRFSAVFDEDAANHIRETIANLHETSESLKSVAKKTDDHLLGLIDSLHETLASIKDTSDHFGVTADILNEQLPQIAQRAEHVLKSADEFIQDNKEPLENTLQSVDQFFVDGGRVVNRLDSYLSAIDRSQFEVGMRAEYLVNDRRAKGLAAINYRPTPTRYYMGEIIGAADYAKKDDYGNFMPPKQGDQDKYYFSFQIGKRYGDLLLRGGLIESSAGGGLDFYALRDKLKMTVDIYDLGGTLDLRGHLPHVRAYLRYTFFRYLDTFVGVDNMINKEAKNVYLGVGVRFIDNEVKTLVGTVGATGLAK